jgi:hypothetical protein
VYEFDVAVAFVASFGSATRVGLPRAVPPVSHWPLALSWAAVQTKKLTVPVGVPPPRPVTVALSVTEPPMTNDVDDGVVTIDASHGWN